ncbi:unnamed protein product, partial [Amoebophrya sp. A25]
KKTQKERVVSLRRKQLKDPRRRTTSVRRPQQRFKSSNKLTKEEKWESFREAFLL